MVPNTSGPYILQYVSIIVSFQHSVVSQDIDHLRVGTWRHAAVIEDVAAGDAKPADDQILDAPVLHFEATVVQELVALALPVAVVVEVQALDVFDTGTVAAA